MLVIVSLFVFQCCQNILGRQDQQIRTIQSTTSSIIFYQIDLIFDWLNFNISNLKQNMDYDDVILNAHIKS